MRGDKLCYNYSFLNKIILFWVLLLLNFAGSPLVPNYIRIKIYRFIGFKIGTDAYIGNCLKLSDALRTYNIEIGDRVSIGDNLYLINTAGPNKSRIGNYYPRITGKIVIDNDAWIGANVTVLPGLSIGEMSVVGAGSVVTKDVGPGDVVAGNPIRLLKKLI